LVYGLSTNIQAFELCFTNVAMFAQVPLRFIALDQITFRLPVPIGSIVRLTSKIVRTTQPIPETGSNAKAHVMVTAEVEDVETGVSSWILCHGPQS
jgi:acyl-coenzyme A thioesterase 9